jgi:hypothetical protein
MSIRSIRDVYKELFGNKNFFETLLWPPNTFAFTSVLLNDSGGYRFVISPPAWWVWPPCDEWHEVASEKAEQWRKDWKNGVKSIDKNSSWYKIVKFLKKNELFLIGDISQEDSIELCHKLVELHSYADEACAGLGIATEVDSAHIRFHMHATNLLCAVDGGSLSTADKTVIKVLPKFKTPGTGISLRSLSHHLAVDRSEVKVKWTSLSSFETPETKTLNLLILPWPMSVAASDFKESDCMIGNPDPTKIGYFEYSPSPNNFNFSELRNCINRSFEKSKKVDGVILPECALDEKDLDRFKKTLSRKNISFFIIGVRGTNKNYALFGFLEQNEYVTFEQNKHHRWLVDKGQILNYHLGSSLHPRKKYWENIMLEERKVNFVSSNDGLTMCHLICEDLARHDPVSGLVRSVGPNFVIALLFDGPQLSNRWSARYASGLADDPGSSVLTVSPLGMVLRSRPKGVKESRVIALWKDSENGPQEIDIAPEKSGVLLSLSVIFKKEWTADGRHDGGMTSGLMLSGFESI